MDAGPPKPAADFADDPVIGIDLGTTNSLVAWCDQSGPRIILDEQGRGLLPSVVRFDPETGKVQAVGFEARAGAVEHPRETVLSVKRLMGRGVGDIGADLPYIPCQVVTGEHDTARVKIGRHVFSPQEVSAVILARLRQRAERYFGKAVRKAVVTVPAYFDDAQRQATRDAGRIAGLDVLRIVNEPTAAALAYNLGRRKSRRQDAPKKGSDPILSSDATVAVFDLGGGTFDVSILRLQQAGAGGGPVSQVLSTHGDTHLGGDDVDQMIIELIRTDIRQRFGGEPDFPPATMQALRSLAEAAKVRLSDQAETTFELDLGGGRTVRRTMNREEFERMIGPWVERAIGSCRAALAAAELTVSQIDRVVMVGGATRTPLVLRRVAEFFQTEPYTALNPDEVVALGAAVQASILAGVNRDMLLLDVIPLSLGIETLGGAVAKLIVANTTIPARATEKFSTFADGQTSVRIHVVQGERELVKDCRSLGHFDLAGIPPMPAGLPKIEVNFLVDANGVLNVSAVERRSEKSAGIQIIPNHGLTRDEVKRMEAESLAHARADMTAHQLIDLRNQARLDMRAIERQIAKVGDELPPEDRRAIEAKVAIVKALTEAASPDPAEFHQALDAMDKATIRLAEIAIRKTLREEGVS